MTQAELNYAKSQEIERVLHDLSNTLTGLLMNAGLLSLALRSNERLRRYADEIRVSATHSADLLRQARLMIDEAESASEMAARVTDACDAEHTAEHAEPGSKRSDSGTRTH